MVMQASPGRPKSRGLSSNRSLRIPTISKNQVNGERGPASAGMGKRSSATSWRELNISALLRQDAVQRQIDLQHIHSGLAEDT